MRNWFVTYCVVLLLHAGSMQAQTHQVSFINFSSRDGMPEKAVYNFAQDHLGFIWIASANGLYRYDGARFRKFQSPADTTDHQISNILQAIYFDSTRQVLWLGSNNAFQYLDLKTYTFTNANYQDPGIRQMIHAEIHNFFLDRKGRLWIGTIGDLLYCYDPEKQTVQDYGSLIQGSARAADAVWKVFETPDSKLWAVTRNHLIRFEPDIRKAEVILTSDLHQFTDGTYDPVRHCIWVAAGLDGLTRYDLHSKRVSYSHFSYQLNQKNYQHKITKLIPDDHGLWIAAGKLMYIDLQGDGKLIEFPDQKHPYGNGLENLTNIFIDAEENLWMGSFTKGMSMHPWQNRQVKLFPVENAQQEFVECLDLLPLGTGDFLLAGGPLRSFIYYNSTSGAMEYLSHPQIDLTPYTTSIHRTVQNVIYGADTARLYIIDVQGKRITPLKIMDQYQRPITGNSDIVSDTEGNLFLAASKAGIYKVNVAAQVAEYTAYGDIEPGIDPILKSDYIYPQFLDNAGNVWFAGTYGVYKRSNSSAHFEKQGATPATNTGATISKPLGISQDLQGHMWIATVSSGIFELSGDTLLNYTKENSGLPTDFCSYIVRDAQGFLWVTTADGMIRFNPISKEVETILGAQQGLSGDNAVYSMTISPDNKLFLNGFGQVQMLDLSTYHRNTYSPAPLITSLTVLDKEINPFPIVRDTSIVLPYDQNFLSFDIAVLSLNNSNQNKIAYQLEGADREWKTNATAQRISYSGLTHGHYTFNVKAANNDGAWNTHILRMHIRITPPFWISWWFLSTLVACVSGLFFIFYRFRLAQIRKEEQLKSDFTLRISELEMKALRAQMNPHFIFNSLNSIQKYILQNETFSASRYLTKFSRLIRLILDHSNQNTILLSSEIEMLRLYIEMESLRFKDKFDYRFDLDDGLQTEHVEIPSMLIQPYVENAIWHGLLHKGTPGILKIEMHQNGAQSLVVTIEDDGIGRAKAAELKSKQVLKKKSYGMQITEDRISIIRKTQGINAQAIVEDLYSPSQEACGTRVKLVIPYTLPQAHTI